MERNRQQISANHGQLGTPSRSPAMRTCCPVFEIVDITGDGMSQLLSTGAPWRPVPIGGCRSYKRLQVRLLQIECLESQV